MAGGVRGAAVGASKSNSAQFNEPAHITITIKSASFEMLANLFTIPVIREHVLTAARPAIELSDATRHTAIAIRAHEKGSLTCACAQEYALI